MNVSLVAFGLPVLIGVALAYVPWKWSLGAFLLVVLCAVVLGIGSPHGDNAPVYFLYFLAMGSPLILLGWGLGKLLRRLTGARPGPQGGPGPET